MAAAGTVSFAGCTDVFDGEQEERDVFRFGGVTSLSGDLRYGGNITRRGYDLWERQVNRQGGIEVDGNQYEVEIEYADAQSEPSSGADAAEQMIDSGVDALFGPFASSVTLAVGPIADREGVPHITGSAESPDIWEEQYRYTFGTVPTVSLIGRDATRNIFEFNPQADSVYITGVNDPFTRATAEAMRTAAENAGIEVLNYELFPRDADWTNPVSEAQSFEPDLHLHGSHLEGSVSFLNSARDLGYEPNGFMIHSDMGAPAFYDALGEDAEYAFGASVWLPQIERSGDTLFESSQEYVDASQDVFDTSPVYTQAASTATGIVYQEALAELGAAPPLTDDEQEELVGIIENIEVDTFYGTVNYETSGEFYHNNVGTDILTIQRTEPDVVEVVSPDDVAETEPIYPIPGWD